VSLSFRLHKVRRSFVVFATRRQIIRASSYRRAHELPAVMAVCMAGQDCCGALHDAHFMVNRAGVVSRIHMPPM